MEYVVEDKASESGHSDPNKWATLMKRTLTVTYDEQEKRIKKLENISSGIKNSTEDVIITMQYVLIFD